MDLTWWELAVRAVAVMAALALAIVAYELARAAVLRRFRDRMQRSVSSYLRENRVRLDRFKFTQKPYVREALLDDPELAETLVALARSGEVGIAELHRRVEVYIEEIVPYFSLVSYYKLGFGVARRALSVLYDGVWDRGNLDEASRSARPGETVVYVVNHRSNADYVLFAYAMSQQVALSYAVGEWARVWPLETLFKSFGSYFVRRGERDPLYHEVLRRYIRLVVRGRLTQGIFLEGGLSRDGALRPPKVGLLDAMLDVVGQDGVDVRFVPVGLNYDRVLEDWNLLREGKGPERPSTLLARLGSLMWLLATLPRAALARMMRALRGLLRRARRGQWGFGVAAVRAGPGLSFRDFFGDGLEDVRALPREERKAALQRFADALMERIGRQVPVTSVPLFCAALLSLGRERVRRDEVVAAIAQRLAELRHAGAPICLGPRLRGVESGRAELEPGAGADLHLELIASDEAEEVLELSLAVLRRRRVLRVLGREIVLRPEGQQLLRYYALSVEPHLGLSDSAPLR